MFSKNGQQKLRNPSRWVVHEKSYTFPNKDSEAAVGINSYNIFERIILAFSPTYVTQITEN
jgi:hypothetical protein